jgi:hypothetical protein
MQDLKRFKRPVSPWVSLLLHTHFVLLISWPFLLTYDSAWVFFCLSAQGFQPHAASLPAAQPLLLVVSAHSQEGKDRLSCANSQMQPCCRTCCLAFFSIRLWAASIKSVKGNEGAGEDSHLAASLFFKAKPPINFF